MSIKCGGCHNYHDSVSEVRECCSNGTKPPTPEVNGYKVNCYAHFCKLCGSWVEAEAGHIEKVNGKWTVFHNAGDCVSKPKTDTKNMVMPDVPEGHYAIKSFTGNNDITFVRVDKPLQGTWAGHTFVKRVIGGKPDSRVRGAKNIHKILQAILDAGPDAAMALYGTELGQCGRCNRHLTDEVSRALGIGPVCREPK